MSSETSPGRIPTRQRPDRDLFEEKIVKIEYNFEKLRRKSVEKDKWPGRAFFELEKVNPGHLLKNPKSVEKVASYFLKCRKKV